MEKEKERCFGMTFYDKFKPDEYTIKDFENWIIVVRPKQITLGDAVIILKNQVPSIGDAAGKDMAELPDVVSWYEGRCKELFGAEKFNYIAAMMKDNFVHFHAIPRYSEEKEFAGIKWKDDFWPKPVSLVDAKTEKETLDAILNAFCS